MQQNLKFPAQCTVIPAEELEQVSGGAPAWGHAYAYFSIPCIAAMINGDMAEIIPSWETGLFAEDISIEQGVHRLSEKPGFGCELSERALQEWCTAKTEYAK